MKQKHLNQLYAGALMTLLAGGFSSCMEKDLFDPEYGKNQLLPKEEYFNFELVGDVKLSVDYKAAGYNNVFFMVFSENPVVTPGKLTLKEGIQPIYSAFTGKDGKYEGVMPIPTAVKEMWIYTNRLGVSGCAKMNFASGAATYDATANSAVGTRVKTSDSQLNKWFNTSMPYSIIFERKQFPMIEHLVYGNEYNYIPTYFSIVKWGIDGVIAGKNDDNDVYIANETEKGSAISEISKRANDYLGTISKTDDRKKLLRDAADLNIKTVGDDTELQVVFLDEAALYNNVFGYYYYKVGSELDKATEYSLKEEYSKVKKYILFPNLTKKDGQAFGALNCQTAVKLKFFGESGNETGVNQFPENYVIGWFLMPQGFTTATTNSWNPQFSIANLGRISNPADNSWGMTVSSNDMKTSEQDFRRFISLYDEKSQSLVIGVEDRIGINSVPDDYMDLTFIVTSNKDLKDENRPSIPEKPKEPKIWTAKGTLAFEDMWPKGGDYDLNDVVVEYERVITYGEGNAAISAEEKFTFKQDVKAADNDDYFAYVAKLGTASASVTTDFTVEKETNSLIIKKSAKEVVSGGASKTFTVTRTFTGGVTKDQVIDDFNPYIIIGEPSAEGRKEVHLPKHDPTSKGDKSSVGMWQDAYYIDFATGLYPFAINIPTTNFVQVTERKRIDAEGEYPDFAKWAASKGTTDKEWYNTGKGGNK